jgi:hypothetical protein
MATVQEYFIVPKDVFEKCHAPPENIKDKFDKLPKSARNKSSQLLEYLLKLVHWDNKTGEISGLLESIYNYVNYSVRGKQRPVDWETFLPNLVSAPQNVLCEKVKREVKVYKRKHGRHVRASRLD